MLFRSELGYDPITGGPVRGQPASIPPEHLTDEDLECLAITAVELWERADQDDADEYLSARQKEVSVSEFFVKNRHLLGFDNPRKALLTTVKEAVDNSLDACEEAGILPDLVVKIEQLVETRFRMTVEDNGPGIVKAQIPKVFEIGRAHV